MKKINFASAVLLICFLMGSDVYSSSLQGSVAGPKGDKGEVGDVSTSPLTPLPRFLEDRNQPGLTDFRSGHPYTKTSAGGTVSDDTSVSLNGIQSFKMTTDGDGALVEAESGILSPTLDLTGKSLVLRVRTEDILATPFIIVDVTSDNFSNYWRIKASGPAQLYFEDASWTLITMNFADAVPIGSPVGRNAINNIRLAVGDNATKSISVHWASLGTLPEPNSGAVIIAFDDGFNDVYDEGHKKMSQYGFPGITYNITEFIDLNGNYMTRDQLHELEDIHGWDVAMHSDLFFTESVSVAQAETEIINQKQWMLDNGFTQGIGHFAYGGGSWRVEILQVAKKLLRSARSTAGSVETFPPANWHKLRSFTVKDTTTPTELRDLALAARDNNGVQMIMFHKLVPTTNNIIEYSISDFGTFIDNLATDGVPVKTLSQVINELNK